MHSRPRGRPPSVKKLDCSEKVKDEVANLRIELGLKRGTKILLLLSLASDEMIRLVTAYPEVFFMDVTAGTNRQKRGMFLAVVKDSSGKTYPGNITIVPSEKSWVFGCIFEHAFCQLYGKATLLMTQLCLTDDDRSEHGPLDNLISSGSIFVNSIHMLCIFHALYKPFQEDIVPLLPKKGDKVTDEGRNYGEYDTLTGWLLQ
jgi:hypothetical protein